LGHPEASPADRAASVAASILDAWREGRIPAALSLIFIRRRHSCPSSAWSWRNRIIAALHGHSDARGFRQWQEAERHVRKGERAFYILGPRNVRLKEDRPHLGLEAGDSIMVGVVAIPVFGYSQTEGAPLPEDPEAAEDDAFLAGLPFADVARTWGLTLTTFSSVPGGKLGSYSPSRQAITVGVRNLSTWAHELMHAADDRRSPLAPGQHLDQEVVAEMGASVLLECVGQTVESDRGGAWRYISGYCAKHQADPLATCEQLLARVVACVALVLDTAQALQGQS
jgi:hypothetical protein